MKNFTMTDNEIKEALDKYTQEAAASADNVRNRVMNCLPRCAKSPPQLRYRRILTAAASLALLFAIFAYTSTGVALANAIKENIIEKLFPPKEISINLEGEEEEITHMPWISEIEDERLSNYAVYIDETNYYMTKENGIAVIRPIPLERYSRNDILSDMGHLWEGLSDEEIDEKIDERIVELEAFYSSLPECKLGITQIIAATPEAAAAAELRKLKSSYADVTDVEKSTLVNGLYIHAIEGVKWDSQVEEVYFIDNQKGGVFVITAQYYMEASEGHGVRFDKMIESFTVIAQKD